LVAEPHQELFEHKASAVVLGMRAFEFAVRFQQPLQNLSSPRSAYSPQLAFSMGQIIFTKAGQL